jgi:hypothetical protein
LLVTIFNLIKNDSNNITNPDTHGGYTQCITSYLLKIISYINSHVGKHIGFEGFPGLVIYHSMLVELGDVGGP